MKLGNKKETGRKITVVITFEMENRKTSSLTTGQRSAAFGARPSSVFGSIFAHQIAATMNRTMTACAMYWSIRSGQYASVSGSKSRIIVAPGRNQTSTKAAIE